MIKVTFVLGTGAMLFAACVAPIATRSSPEHTTHVELENATDRELGVSVALTDGGLGQVTYDGRFRPGEIESLYVRHGADYVFSVTDAVTGEVLATREYPVWAYTNLVYDGAELVVSDRSV